MSNVLLDNVCSFSSHCLCMLRSEVYMHVDVRASVCVSTTVKLVDMHVDVRASVCVSTTVMLVDMYATL